MVRFANGNLSFIQGVDWSGNITSFSNQEIEESWTRLKINHDGNVGIGVNIPSAKLHVDGEIWSNGGLRLFKGDDSRDVRFGLDGNGYMHMEYGGGGVGAYIDLKVNKASDYDARMLVSDAGYSHITGLPVFIRNSTTSAISNGFALSVAGKIRAFEIKIYVGEWADYVFDTDYKLLSLEETEAYINENKHLPGIPSAQEIEENEGVELGEMQKLQMAKIEELTLYMIAMKKELEKLKEENDQLKAAIIK